MLASLSTGVLERGCWYIVNRFSPHLPRKRLCGSLQEPLPRGSPEQWLPVLQRQPPFLKSHSLQPHIPLHDGNPPNNILVLFLCLKADESPGFLLHSTPTSVCQSDFRFIADSRPLHPLFNQGRLMQSLP